MRPFYLEGIQEIRHEKFVHPSFAGVREKLHNVLLAGQIPISIHEAPFTKNVRRARDYIIVYGKHAPTVSWLAHGVRSASHNIHTEVARFFCVSDHDVHGRGFRYFCARGEMLIG